MDIQLHKLEAGNQVFDALCWPEDGSWRDWVKTMIINWEQIIKYSSLLVTLVFA